MQDQFAQRLAKRRAAGFTRQDNLGLAVRAQGIGKPTDVRALARTVDAFEGDEAGVPMVAGSHARRGFEVAQGGRAGRGAAPR